MVVYVEIRVEFVVIEWFLDQEFFCVLIGWIIKVGYIVIGCVEVEKFLLSVVGFEGCVENFWCVGVVGVCIEQFQCVVGLNLCIKIDIEGEYVDQIVDDCFWYILFECCLIQVVIYCGCWIGVGNLVGFFKGIGQEGCWFYGFDVVVVVRVGYGCLVFCCGIKIDLFRLYVLQIFWIWCIGNVKFLFVCKFVDVEQVCKCGVDGCCFVFVCIIVFQDVCKCLFSVEWDDFFVYICKVDVFILFGNEGYVFWGNLDGIVF